jgi:hypothetical protein
MNIFFLLCALLLVFGCSGNRDALKMVEFMQSGSPDEGIAYFNHEIEKDPNNAKAYHHRASLLFRKATFPSNLTDNEKLNLYNLAIADEDKLIVLTKHEADLADSRIDVYEDIPTGKQFITNSDALYALQKRSGYYSKFNYAGVQTRAIITLQRTKLLIYLKRTKEAIESYDDFINFYEKLPPKIISLNPNLKSQLTEARQGKEQLSTELAKGEK